jgi:hypothetical protein
MPVDLSEVVDVSIAADTRVVTRAGFGVPLLVGYHTRFGDRVRSYTRPADMLTDGFVTTDALYKAAVVLCSQPTRPPIFKIGRRAGAPAQTVRYVPTSAVEGVVYEGSIGSESWTRTVGAASSIAAECTAIAAAINALTGAFTATASATYVDVATDVAGVFFAHHSWGTTNAVDALELEDRTPVPGTSLQTDLAAIYAYDSDWYGLDVVDAHSEAQIADVALWATANKVLYLAPNFFAGVGKTGTTTDIASDMKTLAYRNVSIWYVEDGCDQGFVAGLLGKCLPFDPGSETWVFKEVTGVAADEMSTSRAAAAHAKYANTYQPIGGFNLTRKDGLVASGEKIDVIRFVDWLEARVKEAVFGLLASLPKLPYTDAGLAQIAGAIKAVLLEAERVGGLDAGTSYVSVPRVSSISAADRALRDATGITFGGRLAGAVHHATLRGQVSV